MLNQPKSYREAVAQKMTFYFMLFVPLHMFGRKPTGDVVTNDPGSGRRALYDITKGELPELCATARTPWGAEARRGGGTSLISGLAGPESRVIAGGAKFA